MKRSSRRASFGLLLTVGFSALALVACSGAEEGGGTPDAVGQVNLPLTTLGSSGATYRLRNANFVIQPQYYNPYEEAGAGGSSGAITVSSESDPDAKNISVSVPEGYYYVQLGSGWSLEKITSGGVQTVPATLLSGTTQWVYVSRQSTSWAEYSFGIGGKEIWLNGKLNIGIDVQESPGGAGAGGAAPIEEVGGAAG